MRDENWQMVFKYWIALDIDNAPRTGFLKPTHLGLLMFLKSKPSTRSLSALPFEYISYSGAACVLSCLRSERQGLGRQEAPDESKGDGLIRCMARSPKAVNSRFCSSRRRVESHSRPHEEGGWKLSARRTEGSRHRNQKLQSP